MNRRLDTVLLKEVDEDSLHEVHPELHSVVVVGVYEKYLKFVDLFVPLVGTDLVPTTLVRSSKRDAY